MEKKDDIKESDAQEVSELARRLANQRRIIESACEVCGKVIVGTTRKRYCSHAHRQAAYNARQKQLREKQERQEE